MRCVFRGFLASLPLAAAIVPHVSETNDRDWAKNIHTAPNIVHGKRGWPQALLPISAMAGTYRTAAMHIPRYRKKEQANACESPIRHQAMLTGRDNASDVQTAQNAASLGDGTLSPSCAAAACSARCRTSIEFAVFKEKAVGTHQGRLIRGER